MDTYNSPTASKVAQYWWGPNVEGQHSSSRHLVKIPMIMRYTGQNGISHWWIINQWAHLVPQADLYLLIRIWWMLIPDLTKHLLTQEMDHSMILGFQDTRLINLVDGALDVWLVLLKLTNNITRWGVFNGASVKLRLDNTTWMLAAGTLLEDKGNMVPLIILEIHGDQRSLKIAKTDKFLLL